jgi:hypothetical protein
MIDQHPQQLLTLWHRLNDVDQARLLDYAQLLVSASVADQILLQSHEAINAHLVSPQHSLAEPHTVLDQDGNAESVVLAIRRLRRQYPMLERRKLLGPLSTLLAQHMLEDRPAAAVIAECAQLCKRLSAAQGDRMAGSLSVQSLDSESVISGAPCA